MLDYHVFLLNYENNNFAILLSNKLNFLKSPDAQIYKFLITQHL